MKYIIGIIVFVYFGSAAIMVVVGIGFGIFTFIREVLRRRNKGVPFRPQPWPVNIE